MRNGATRWIPGLLFGLLVWGTAPGATRELLGPGHEVCGSCHTTGEGGAWGTLPDAVVCLDCHTAASMQPVPLGGDAWPAHYRTDSSVGGPMDCLTCHDPHATDRDGRVREVAAALSLASALDRESRLCVQCHEDHTAFGEVQYSRHPVGIPVPGGLRPSADPSATPLADVAGTDNPADDVIACTTCHTVHERRERHLLRWSGREGMIAGCTACHDLSRAAGGGDGWVSVRP